jgi:hypothetical protein
MASYLLTCDCGKTIPVELGQAGGRVGCSCGMQLDVPTLRQLRQLPQATTDQKSSSGSWGTRQGWITVSLIVIAVLLGASAWTWWNQPAQPVFVADDYLANVEKSLTDWTPTDAWKRWIEYYRPLAERGLPIFMAGNAGQIEAEIARAKFLRGTLLSIAAVFAAAAAATYFWPKPVAVKARR